MNDTIHQYIESLLPSAHALFSEMEHFAQKEKIPIMEKTALHVLLQFLRIQNPSSILEIGTAIGYSALRMAEALPHAKIVTIEIDDVRAGQAEDNIKSAGAEGQVTILRGDALELVDEAEKLGPFDAVFIDAAKGQYLKFFEMYSTLLTEKGCIYSDNVLFRGLVAEETVEQKRFRGIAKKMKAYNQILMENPEFVTTIIPVGDGLAVSKKE